MTPLETLKQHWGHDSFRPLQEEIIDSVMQGRDTLALMPTGGGKSVTFQVPGLVLGGLTLVVTPLISLMKDQVDNLQRLGIRAVYLHSGMTSGERRVAWEKIVNGQARFLYTSPERLTSERFLTELRHLKITLLVVDEAHCISQWGYDFRPSYLQVKVLRKTCPGVPVVALTATATPAVAADIMRQLEFREPNLKQMSFSRDNISYVVRQTADKHRETLHILSRTTGSAIVYVRSRRKTREIALFLETAGIPASFYHAGLDHETKTSRQNDWKSGQTRVMVATNAFGMGIDKPDVRVVVHFDLPPSLEEYYQEAGRAGRDGKEAYAVLLSAPRDPATLRRHVTQAFPPRDDIRLLYERLCNFLHLEIGEGYDRVFEFDLDKFCQTFRMQEATVRASMRLLGQSGYLEFIEERESNSRVLINVGREELYHLRDTGPKTERTLQLLLRLYPGLFSDYVLVSEGRIAREAALTEQEVYESLSLLSRMKVMTYVPRRRTPYIYLPTSREESRYISIGKTVYEERKKAMAQRTESMIAYAGESAGCRVRMMLAYFGEKEGRDCGKCDVCRKRRRARQ